MNLLIRPENDLDRLAIRAVHHAAFGTTAEAELVDALRDAGDVAVSMVAVTRKATAMVAGSMEAGSMEAGSMEAAAMEAAAEQQVVGHILFSRLTIATPASTLDALCLAPMAVVPALQRRGIGSRLVRAGLDACREQGHAIATVLGHPAFYPRFGFRPELARTLQSPFGGGDAWMAIELVPGVLAGVAGRVAFPAAFRRFE